MEFTHKFKAFAKPSSMPIPEKTILDIAEASFPTIDKTDEQVAQLKALANYDMSDPKKCDIEIIDGFIKFFAIKLKGKKKDDKITVLSAYLKENTAKTEIGTADTEENTGTADAEKEELKDQVEELEEEKEDLEIENEQLKDKTRRKRGRN